MNTLFLPLVDWGMGIVLIGVFALVCVVLVLVVYNLSQSKDNNSMPENIDEVSNPKVKDTE